MIIHQSIEEKRKLYVCDIIDDAVLKAAMECRGVRSDKCTGFPGGDQNRLK